MSQIFQIAEVVVLKYVFKTVKKRFVKNVNIKTKWSTKGMKTISRLKKLIKRIRFWVWGAMHYNRFEEFFVILLPPMWVKRGYYNKETKEVVYLLGFRFPRIIYHEPSYTDIYINNPWNKLPDIDWDEDLEPF